MIKLVEIPDDLQISGDTPFGCRIRSLAGAYGVGKPFARFWIQDGGSVLAMLDDTLLLEEGETADWEELAGFVRALGAKALSCTGEAAERLGFPAASAGEIMAASGISDRDCFADAELNPGLREAYALLCAAKSEHFAPPEFGPFYLDVSYRIRHGAALSAGIRAGGELAAFALCSSLTRDAAVVSAVAVSPERRRRGLGRSVLAALARAAGRKRLYVFRADGENGAFYRSLGFRSCGRWAECRPEGGIESEGKAV